MTDQPPTPRRLLDILIDDATWEEAAPERRREFETAIRDLLEETTFDLDGNDPLRLLVSRGPERITFDIVDCDGGRLVARAGVPFRDLAGHLEAYLETCREMSILAVGDNSPRLEALDIAKRLIHDEAAEAVQALCRALRPDHTTARRLFTLIVTLRYDTTILGA